MEKSRSEMTEFNNKFSKLKFLKDCDQITLDILKKELQDFKMVTYEKNEELNEIHKENL